MKRRPNRKTTRDLPGIVLEFKLHEFKALKHNEPGPSGKMGGYQKMENILLERTDPETLRCYLPPHLQSRCQDYCVNNGPGGPNKRIRIACIPAFRRQGIELLPGFSASYERQRSDDAP